MNKTLTDEQLGMIRRSLKLRRSAWVDATLIEDCDALLNHIDAEREKHAAIQRLMEQAREGNMTFMEFDDQLMAILEGGTP